MGYRIDSNITLSRNGFDKFIGIYYDSLARDKVEIDLLSKNAIYVTDEQVVLSFKSVKDNKYYDYITDALKKLNDEGYGYCYQRLGELQEDREYDYEEPTEKDGIEYFNEPYLEYIIPGKEMEIEDYLTPDENCTLNQNNGIEYDKNYQLSSGDYLHFHTNEEGYYYEIYDKNGNEKDGGLLEYSVDDYVFATKIDNILSRLAEFTGIKELENPVKEIEEADLEKLISNEEEEEDER